MGAEDRPLAPQNTNSALHGTDAFDTIDARPRPLAPQTRKLVAAQSIEVKSRRGAEEMRLSGPMKMKSELHGISILSVISA